MQAYYERGGVRLYHGEAQQVMSELGAGSMSALITDPPYCSGAATSSAKTMDPADKYCQNGRTLGRPTFGGDAKDQRSFVAWSMAWLTLARSLLRPDAYALVFTDWRQLPCTTDALQGADYVWRGLMAWDKGNGARSPHKGYARHQCEYVVWGTNGKCRPRQDAGPFPGCYHVPIRQQDKFHMVGKPTELMLQIVEFCPKGETVLDPFAGSGTTLVACARTGRKAVGIEREIEYCKIAAQRLDQEFDQAPSGN